MKSLPSTKKIRQAVFDGENPPAYIKKNSIGNYAFKPRKISHSKYRRLCGMTLQEIATGLGWSIGSVHASFKNDKKKFLKLIKNLKAIR